MKIIDLPAVASQRKVFAGVCVQTAQPHRKRLLRPAVCGLQQAEGK